MSPERHIWTDQELADEWKIPVRTLQQMCRDGRLRSFKAGRSVRITDAAKRQYEESEDASRRQGSAA
jgi:excisionase family DNA binding protein